MEERLISMGYIGIIFLERIAKFNLIKNFPLLKLSGGVIDKNKTKTKKLVINFRF